MLYRLVADHEVAEQDGMSIVPRANDGATIFPDT